MSIKIPRLMSAFLIVFVLIVIVIGTFYFTREDDPRLLDAYNSYRQGELAKHPMARQEAFNRALQLYQTLEQEYHPRFGTGRLYYNIGNTYFQLEEYPWAILNYLRAQALMPREQDVLINLEAARKKLSISTHVASQSLLVYFTLSLPERLQLFFVLSVVAFAAVSASIWLSSRWFRRIAWLFAVLAGVLSLSFIYTYYLSPTQGVLIKASAVYRDAGTQYATVYEQPLPAGVLVEVIDSRANGAWLKIISPQGDPGFVPIETIRLLE